MRLPRVVSVAVTKPLNHEFRYAVSLAPSDYPLDFMFGLPAAGDICGRWRCLFARAVSFVAIELAYIARCTHAQVFGDAGVRGCRRLGMQVFGDAEPECIPPLACSRRCGPVKCWCNARLNLTLFSLLTTAPPPALPPALPPTFSPLAAFAWPKGKLRMLKKTESPGWKPCGCRFLFASSIMAACVALSAPVRLRQTQSRAGDEA